MAAIRNGARGGRDAKRFAKQERFTDSLYDQGVLTRPEDAREAALAARGLVIDDEFKALIPPQTAEENDALEQSILAEGCRDPLVIWKEQNILVDGHHRYEICIRHSLSYNVRDKSFETREDVMLWMLNNQRSRRNLTPYNRDLLALKEQKLLEIVTKRTQGQRTDLFSELKKSVDAEPKNSWKEAAKNNETSVGSMHKTATIENEAPEPIRKKAQDGDLSRDRAYKLTKALKGASQQVIDFVTVHSMDNDEKVEILKRLEKSAGSPETNGTYYEIIRTGGFHYGEGMKLRCDFVADSVQKIQRALDDIADQHAKIAADARRQDRIDKIIASATTPELPSIPTKYAVIYADPPWRYDYSKSDSRAIENQYPTMELSEICALPVQDITTSDAILFMWATSPKLAESMRVIEAWGFTYRTCMVWHKDKIGMGYYARQQHELLLIATVGSLPTPPESARPSSVISAPRGEHSRKPEIFYEVIERMYPELPKVELFSRNARAGWYGWGYESA